MYVFELIAVEDQDLFAVAVRAGYPIFTVNLFESYFVVFSAGKASYEDCSVFDSRLGRLF